MVLDIGFEAKLMHLGICFRRLVALSIIFQKIEILEDSIAGASTL